MRLREPTCASTRQPETAGCIFLVSFILHLLVSGWPAPATCCSRKRITACHAGTGPLRHSSQRGPRTAPWPTAAHPWYTVHLPYTVVIPATLVNPCSSGRLRPEPWVIPHTCRTSIRGSPAEHTCRTPLVHLRELINPYIIDRTAPNRGLLPPDPTASCRLGPVRYRWYTVANRQ